MRELVYQINTPQVIREFFDDEAVIINLELGIYYSLDAVGGFIWGLIEQRASNIQIVEKISQVFNNPVDNIKKDILEFIDQLVTEELICINNNNHLTPIEDNMLAINNNGKELIYSKPILNKYTDMQELLLLDPIHEVDEAGWPNVKSKETEK